VSTGERMEPVPTIPRSVRRGPPITLTCECGATRHLRYGDRWSCEKCSRSWDTAKIPVDQYAAIRATQLRFRRVPIAISALALAAVIACIVVGKALGGLLVVAILASTWSMFFRPLHRRRYREALADLPTWQIEPD
jgi:hypothetical protein